MEPSHPPTNRSSSVQTIDKLFRAISMFHAAYTPPNAAQSTNLGASTTYQAQVDGPPAAFVHPVTAQEGSSTDGLDVLAQHPQIFSVEDGPTIDFRFSPSQYNQMVGLLTSTIVDLSSCRTQGIACSETQMPGVEPLQMLSHALTPQPHRVSLAVRPGHVNLPGPAGAYTMAADPQLAGPPSGFSLAPSGPRPASDELRGASVPQPSLFQQLPEEILVTIFRLARKLGQESRGSSIPRPPPSSITQPSLSIHQPWPLTANEHMFNVQTIADNILIGNTWAIPEPEVHHEHWVQVRHSAPQSGSTSKKEVGTSHAQAQAHSWCLISKSLMPAVRLAAWRQVYIRNQKQVKRLVSMWSRENLPKTETSAKNPDGTIVSGRSQMFNAGRFVYKLDIQVSELRTDDPEANRRGTRGLRQIPRSSRHSSHSTKALTNLQAQQSGEGQLLPRLFQLLPNLRSLSLSMHRVINSHNYRAIGTGLSSQSSGWLGSEVDLMASLCSLKTLRRLSLCQAIDYNELEVLLPSLPELKELRLDGGVQNVDGTEDVDPAAIHQCRLEVLVIQRSERPTGVSEISAPQLRWVLAQSIGTIREIDLVLGTILQAPGGAGQLQARSVNWAKPEFVQLLGQLGPTLKSLALRTSTIVPSFGGGMHPGIPQNNFQNEAQNGFLDHSLRSCTQLEHLVIEWHGTGPDLLNSLTYQHLDSNMDDSAVSLVTPHPSGLTSNPSAHVSETSLVNRNGRFLKTLSFCGRPQHTSASMLREVLEEGTMLMGENSLAGTHSAPGDDNAIHLDGDDKTSLMFPSLKSINLVEFPSERLHQLPPWPSRELRKLRAVCKARGIAFGL